MTFVDLFDNFWRFCGQTAKRSGKGDACKTPLVRALVGRAMLARLSPRTGNILLLRWLNQLLICSVMLPSTFGSASLDQAHYGGAPSLRRCCHDFDETEKICTSLWRSHPRLSSLSLRGGCDESTTHVNPSAVAIKFEHVTEGRGALCPQRDAHIYIHYTVTPRK
jgi:hypothetical protein